MKDRLNTRVKQRAPFRPFAPAVLEDWLPLDGPIDQAKLTQPFDFRWVSGE
jgi:predicted NodU family carbamoyl transferase